MSRLILGGAALQRWREHSNPLFSVERTAGIDSAERRKNATHGAGRGVSGNEQAPGGVSIIARRFSAGKSGENGQVPEGRLRFSRTHNGAEERSSRTCFSAQWLLRGQCQEVSALVCLETINGERYEDK